MPLRCAFALVLLTATLLAQSAPPPCPADRPVDDIIAEVHNQQSKKKNRNTNPFPDVTCIMGWCRDHSKTPPTVPRSAPEAETPRDSDTPSTSISSSETPQSRCNDAMERALDAAHSVEVGDFNFAQKNYRGALLRYQDALGNKPEDVAIHVRLGQAYEKLNQPAQAIEQYSNAQKFPGPKKWTDEAQSALQRLQKH